MKHYVLLKLAPGADVESVEEKIFKAYDKLDEELEWLNRPAVYRSCTGAASGADLMVVVELDGTDHLEEYLEHPRHLKMQKAIGDSVVSATTFDHY